MLVISVLYILIGLRLRRSRRALAARRHSASSTGSVRATSASSTHSQARVIRMLGEYEQCSSVFSNPVCVFLYLLFRVAVW
ncbi:hypothetical protein ONE63_002377 [Megalurothrips usitatus]|uniref:Secreted protein n=1 Tax=Megalurothrips usitatus TaxID=439358 RepID=A0AAV7XBJ1_9NEOP|nr:hypothetical protein ONE63_002377 [Megalurothrips usitatus]